MVQQSKKLHVTGMFSSVRSKCYMSSQTNKIEHIIFTRFQDNMPSIHHVFSSIVHKCQLIRNILPVIL